MIFVGDETPFDLVAREALLDVAMGADRKLKSSERLREGQVPAEDLALIARDLGGDGPARVVGTVRLWHVLAGGVPALLLGPLAVSPERQGDGIGGRLVGEAIARASAAGHRAILLVGDPEYYARFGFTAEHTRDLAMPGAYEQRRLVGLELIAGALQGASGMVCAPEADGMALVASRESSSLRWGGAGLSHAA